MDNENNKVSLFENETLGSLRTTIDDYGRPVFCLKDACTILDIKNPSDAKKRLKSSGVVRITKLDANGKFNNYLYVTESNLYKLIFQSRKEEAQQFVDWVTEVILPQIRKYGRYDLKSITKNNETAMAFLDSYNEFQTRIAILEKNEQETKEARTYVKRALDSNVLKDLFDVPAILNIPGIGNTEVLKVLRDNAVIDESNMPYQEYVDKGWFRVDTHSYQDKTAGTVVHKRVFCYKAAINQIRRMLDKMAGGKNER
ncbi:MAG: BRO family protein [Bacilli bacterium]